MVVGEGNLLSYWKNITKLSFVNNKIEFTGKIEYSKVGNYYKESDIFLFPSLREGSPTVILEAMSYHLPVITFKQNGADIMLNDKSGGILIPLETKEQMLNDFINSIIELYKNPELRFKIGQTARKEVEENFVWGKRGIKMNKIYEQYITNE